jgi:uncharacterized membrane protein YbaN (DUF454 family)
VYDRNALFTIRNSPLAKTPPSGLKLPVIPGVTAPVDANPPAVRKEDSVVHPALFLLSTFYPLLSSSFLLLSSSHFHSSFGCFCSSFTNQDILLSSLSSYSLTTHHQSIKTVRSTSSNPSIFILPIHPILLRYLISLLILSFLYYFLSLE